jgi:hypothetical protein
MAYEASILMWSFVLMINVTSYAKGIRDKEHVGVWLGGVGSALSIGLLFITVANGIYPRG